MPCLYYCFTTGLPGKKTKHAKDMKPFSVRITLCLMGVLSALFWNKVPTKYDDERCFPLYGSKKRNPPRPCLPLVSTFYTITCHFTTLKVLIFTICTANSNMWLLPAYRQEPEIKWQEDVHEFIVFWFQMRRGQHRSKYSPLWHDSTGESICSLTSY